VDETDTKEMFTLGHSDRSREEFLDCLASFGVVTVADVRSWPVSRRHPQFSRDELEPALAAVGVRYRYLGRELGGYRSGGYEDHVGTSLFREGLSRLAAMAKDGPLAIVCAERDPADCHRRFISEALAERGYRIRHIVAPGRELLPGERPGDQGTLFD
jgi:uncharacterized protein (DUF488 family)